MEKAKAYTINLSLIVLCLSGSSFLVWESSSYYQQLYALAGFPKIAGLCLAALTEAFLITLVIAIPNDKESKGTRYFLFSIIAAIYMLSVFAAGANIGKPMLEQWSRSSQDEKLFGVLMEEQKSIQSQLQLFQKQGQRLNTAISVQASRKSFQELKEHLTSENPINTLLIKVELLALWALRVLIQLANLVCGRLLANNIRKIDVAKLVDTQNQIIESAKPIVIKKWKARYSRSENGFVGVMEFSDGTFISISPDQKRKYRTFTGAVKFFDGSPYQGKIGIDPTWQMAN